LFRRAMIRNVPHALLLVVLRPVGHGGAFQ
jgi:hypothetical protein